MQTFSAHKDFDVWNPQTWESELSLHADMTRVYGDAWRAYLSLRLDDPIDDCYAGSVEDWEDFVIENMVRDNMGPLEPMTEDRYEDFLNYGYELSQHHEGARVNGTLHLFRISQ
jgi:hypothetical protein